ncbi:MAG: glycoside hydrolase [Euryarchaeota archaeon]|nr:glycoside hydrolase [Euryarchaeota archaeon]
MNPPFKPVFPIALLVVTLLAGCVAPKEPPASDPTGLIEETLSFGYTCPPGDTLTLSNGLCVTTFQDARETFEEPYIAVRPDRPETMVVGMNSWHAEPRPTLIGGFPSMELGRVALFVTEDGGATWTRVQSPPILYGTDRVGKTSYSGDPTLAFDSRGVLHYFQTSVAFDDVGGPAFPYLDIQYARSEDLGASWSKNVLIADDGDNDRPWLTIGRDDHLFATWRNNMVEAKPPSLTWSQDGGTTWEIHPAPPGCTDTGRAIVHGDAVLMPCALAEEESKVQVNRFEPATRRFEPVSQIPVPEGDPTYNHAQWDVSPDGAVLALGARTDSPHGFVVFSRDSGAGWSEPLLFTKLCACQPETGALHLYGMKFDAWGAVHLLLTDAMVGPDQVDENRKRYTTGERGVFHVVIDADGNALHTQRLPTSIEEDPRVPPTMAAPFGRDDYYIPAFWDGGGAIAWTRDKGIDLAHVVVDGSADAPSG